MNNFTGNGFLPTNPILLHIGKNRLPLCKFQLSMKRYYRVGTKGKQEKIDTVNCICWGSRGEAIATYCKAGSHIAIAGSVVTTKYKDKNTNETEFKTEIEVNNSEFINNINSNVDFKEYWEETEPTLIPELNEKGE